MGSRFMTKSISSSDPVKMDSKLENIDSAEIQDMDWSFEQEILLLYSLDGHKPVGSHKHFQMILIQDKLSKAMNKPIATKVIWKKLATFYDLEALDEAEAEADAANEVILDFSLPEDEYGELKKAKINSRPIKIEKMEPEEEIADYQIVKQVVDIKIEPENSAIDVKVEDGLESPKGPAKDGKKEIIKRGPKKKEATPTKESVAPKKDTLKETSKKEVVNLKDTLKDSKRGAERRDEAPKKTPQETKKDSKEEKKEQGPKTNKRESMDRKVIEQNKKDLEAKKNEQKKVIDTPKQRESGRPRSETPKQLRTETPKRSEGKPTRAETPKNTPAAKPNRVEVLRKEAGSDKKKEVDKKTEKSPEKTPDSVRGAKLRNREKKDEPETPVSGTKRERSRDSNSKVDVQEEPVVKRAKTPVISKVRPTRNSIEPQPKPASPVVNPNSPQKRRTRML